MNQLDELPPPAISKPRILVIRGGAIGDFILTLPAIRLLRENFPNAHLEILGYRHIVALAEGRGYADSTRSIEYGPLAGFFARNGTLAEELSEYFHGFQQVVSWLFDPDGIFEANLRRAGVKNLIKAFSQIDDGIHAARQLARPLESMALYLENHMPAVLPSSADKQAAEEWLRSHAAVLERNPTLCALHPGSGGARKNWPVENWAALGKMILESGLRPTLLLVGGEADHAALTELSKVWAGEPVIVARDLPLPTLAALLQRCRFFLGHDSGISHLAAAVGTPSVLLFGPTDPAIWAPPHRHVTVVQASNGDLKNLSVETVRNAVLR